MKVGRSLRNIHRSKIKSDIFEFALTKANDLEKSSRSDDEDDDVDELPPPPKRAMMQRRSVSAEVYGAWNQQKTFVPPQYPKTADQEKRLKDILSQRQLIVFESLDEKDIDVILLAMEKCSFKTGQRIIQQGDDGECLYVVETGHVECKVLQNGIEKVVKTCAPGDVFGELALLYNCPRAASVDSKSDCTVWRLDRETFNHVAKDAALKKNVKHDAFLRKVSLFSSLNDHQRSQIADSLKTEKVHQDDIVVRQGEEGDKFYIVEEGTLVALKSVNNGPPKQMMRFSAGDYFGELAMLKDQPRAATIKVTSSSATILSMDRDTFKRLLGPLEHLMSSRSSKYSEEPPSSASLQKPVSGTGKKVTVNSDDEDDDVDELPPPPKRAMMQRRSVSAEVYGAFNQQKTFVPPQYPKTADQEKRLKDILSQRQLIVFESLDEKDIDVILLAMEKCSFKTGQRIIQQGDDGECLYVVETGHVECKVLQNGIEKVVKTCAPGDVFGELALLYNCPRAASVDSKSDCTVWRLDRETFNHVAKDAALKKNVKHDAFLRKVSLFSSLNDHQRSQIADSLKTEKVHQDDIVVRQGEEGDKFYIVEEGTLVALKSVNNGPPKQMMRFSAGDYFGELAMLKDQPRAATIKVTSSSATILSMDRDTFKRLLGPLEHLMSSRSSKYSEEPPSSASLQKPVSGTGKKVTVNSDDEDDDVDELPPPPKRAMMQRRSVSAEVYGAFNQQKTFVPPQYPKTADQEKRLKDILSQRQLIVFESLDEKDIDVILLAMEKCSFKTGQRIIQQGDDGECLYVVETGHVECKVLQNGIEKVVKTCAPGDVFGELALLYNCPRAASVDSKSDCTVWRLDRETFNHVAKDAALKKNVKHDAFLRKVSLFSSLNDHQRSQIADSLKTEKVHQDDIVVRQGEEGDKFYIVEEGTLVALKSVNNGPPKQMMRFSAGDYFGELAMLKDQPRAATIKVTSSFARVLSMDRDTFKRLLGPLEHLMSSRSNTYK